MAKSKKVDRKYDSQCHGINNPCKLSSRCMKGFGDARHERKQVKSLENKQWENTLCSVCMEYPHNAVLLLCSSYDKGCRPYMCATSHRYSNCLEQYKKAYTKAPSNKITNAFPPSPDILDFSEELSRRDGKSDDISELLCPLCRGQVKGWTVVEPARRYFDAKKRSCTKDGCSFVGNYQALRKHVKLEHPLSRPRDVDPTHAEKWKKLENERDLNDVFSTIRSTMPGALVIGDYVIERNIPDPPTNYFGDDYFNESILRFPTSWNNPLFPLDNFGQEYDSSDDFITRIGTRSGVPSRRQGNIFSRISRTHARFWASRRARRLRPSRY